MLTQEQLNKLIDLLRSHQEDFVQLDSELIFYWIQYANGELKQQLEQFSGSEIKYDYDWRLNQAQP